MALTAGNVIVAGKGAVYVAPKGTTGPTTAIAAVGNSFVDVGFIHDDGVKFAPDESSKDINAWQGNALVRTLITKEDFVFEFTMLETNATTLGVYFKTPGFTGGAIVTGQRDHRAFVIDVIDGTDVERWVLPDAEVTKRGDLEYKNDEAARYKVTIKAYADANGSPGFYYRGTAA